MAERHERRTIADAMQVTPEAMAFIQGNPTKKIDIKPKPTGVPDDLGNLAAVQDETPDDLEQQPVEKIQSRGQGTSDRRRTYRSNPQKQPIQNNNDLGFGLNNLLVPLTTRLQPATAAALKRAGLEQKLRGQQPSTVQEIVEIAIRGWLKQNGFLG